ncbi:enoyl-CoA hydratase/isomerase family protein [Rhodococcus fascians]|nr:enoyl-CoA hydratase/isomerase family protein [Rhodococcus fascians]MBY4140942.1 enoyl-CoA hydratase/isomerase family protein [Rhodococcus fascians]MBY4219606.1 enoyl-CoA hydratase/isomerase family protein [Rhodococcus fascians]MBY4221915.1 enoyl-CoA hydratase/isomerase family protein [Rhodococcus fascians]MBY4233916.1 enoyl-CoA hydratase/isomerase family protein [Rhodococcus fascians]
MIGVPARIRIVDLGRDDTPPPGVQSEPECIIGVSRDGTLAPAAERWLDRADFSITTIETDDSRLVRVSDVDAVIDTCRSRVSAHPVSTRVLTDILRCTWSETTAGLLVESLGYSTLQAGSEFQRWLRAQKPRRRRDGVGFVLVDREGDRLFVTLNQPDRHNAFSDVLRAELLDALSVALLDTDIRSVHLSGAGPSFSSGGDLSEFGLFDDPARSHAARMDHSPALALVQLANRLGRQLSARVHGAVLGSGLEMAAFCTDIEAHPDSVFGLPELDLGLIPGAGGTVSVTRRIGRWRTAYLVISGHRIDATTAAAWGLVDHVR